VTENIQKLKEILPSGIPVHICFSGKGTIHKKLTLSEGDTDKVLLNKVLPNANQEDFYLQRTLTAADEVYVSVVRRETADFVLRELNSQGINAVGCSFGPFSINTVLPLMGELSSGRELKFSGSVLSISNGRIDGFKHADTNGAGESVLIGNESIQGNKLVAFSAALQYFIGDEGDLNIPGVKNAKEEYKQKQLFKTAGIAMLSLFFITLMANVFLFTHFSESFEDLNREVLSSTSLLDGLDKMNEEIGKKQDFLEQTGLLDASRTSFYADNLASDIPTSIQLTELNINPLVKNNAADDNDLNFTSHKIRVSGSCVRSTELNEWIKNIKQKDWVAGVTVLNYTQAQSKNEGDFSLEITVK
jgi:Tfp pilus assembly protein PilN